MVAVYRNQRKTKITSAELTDAIKLEVKSVFTERKKVVNQENLKIMPAESVEETEVIAKFNEFVNSEV